VRQCKGCTDLKQLCSSVRATPSNIPKWASCRLYKNSGSGEMRLMGVIRNGKGVVGEIGASHQIWWNILREHNWGVPSAHIMFIYYVTYILECLIMLQGHTHTGAYTNTIITCMRNIIPMINLRTFGVAFGLSWAEINKENKEFNFNVFLTCTDAKGYHHKA